MCIGKIKKIKSLVTLQQVLDLYGIEVIHGYIKCPFHKEKTPSMIVHKDRVHCFGCGITLDVIDFVSKYNEVSISKAIDILDKAFNCGVNEPMSEEEYAKFIEEMENTKKEHERKQKVQDFADECLSKILNEMQQCREKINQFEKTMDKLDVIYRDYGDSFEKQVTQSVKARFRIEWLDWLYSVITDRIEKLDDEYCLTYGCDRLEILKKIYKGEIKI